MFHKGEERTFDFKLIANIEGEVASTELITSSGTTNEFETFILDTEFTEAVSITIAGYGNSGSDWNSYSEVELYGQPSAVTAVEPASLPSFNIYPNPVSDEFYIVQHKGANKKLEITSSEGRVVKSFNVNNQSILKINVSGLVPGLYYIRTDTGKLSKFIKN